MVDFNYLPTYQPQLVSALYPFFWGGDISPGIKVLASRHQGTGCLKAFGVLVGVYTVGAVRSLNGCEKRLLGQVGWWDLIPIVRFVATKSTTWRIILGLVSGSVVINYKPWSSAIWKGSHDQLDP